MEYLQYFGYILLALAILLLMVLIHELGHYTVAKILGFSVDEFSIGFGPKLFSHRRKNGELFSIRMLPLGGYCAFTGEKDDGKPNEQNDTEKALADSADESKEAKSDDDDLLSYVMKTKIDEQNAEKAKADEQKPVRLDKNGNPVKTFNEQKPWKRILVLLGGVAFNFLSAFIFSFIFICAVGYNPQVTARYENEAGVAYNENIQVGDVILAVNGEKINVMNQFTEILSKYEEGDELTFTVKRDGKKTDITVVMQTLEELDGRTGIGITSDYVHGSNPVGEAFTHFIPFTFKLSWSIIGSFGNILIGKEKITSMTGPVGSITTMASLSRQSWQYTLMLLPLLASNLAIFNILPIPALDGAHIVFTIIEWIRKKPIPRNIEAMIHGIGLVVLLLFVVVVDILSFVL